mmetsp:Transcript_116840/g.363086  ORF Transcript_116840/g.363086 Transcript_116840/m.363086 type:complete len:273 (-) Transcript_116840:276-1094(-)
MEQRTAPQSALHPCRSRCSALVVRRLLAGLGLAGLLGLHGAPVAREVLGLLEHRPPVVVVLLHGASKAKSNCTGLTTEATAERFAEHVKVVLDGQGCQRLARLHPPNRNVVEVLDGVAAVDDELPVPFDDPHDGARRLPAPPALPVLHLLAVQLHVPVPVLRAAVAPLAARRGGLQGRVVLLRVQGELEALDHRDLLVHGPLVGVELPAVGLRLRGVLALDALLPGVHVVLLARDRVLVAYLHVPLRQAHERGPAPPLPRGTPAAEGGQHGS